MRRLALLLIGSWWLAACTSSEVVVAHSVPLSTATEAVAEEDLLDVGIVLFDSGVPEGEVPKEVLEELIRDGTFVHIRRSESVYMSVLLRQHAAEDRQLGLGVDRAEADDGRRPQRRRQDPAFGRRLAALGRHGDGLDGPRLARRERRTRWKPRPARSTASGIPSSIRIRTCSTRSRTISPPRRPSWLHASRRDLRHAHEHALRGRREPRRVRGLRGRRRQGR